VRESFNAKREASRRRLQQDVEKFTENGGKITEVEGYKPVELLFCSHCRTRKARAKFPKITGMGQSKCFDCVL